MAYTSSCCSPASRAPVDYLGYGRSPAADLAALDGVEVKRKGALFRRRELLLDREWSVGTPNRTSLRPPTGLGKARLRYETGSEDDG
jgi:hypothetical protein